jgi:hypothetical protein
MLSTTAIVAKFAQNCQIFAKICPKTICLRNFEIPPKIEVFDVFQNKKHPYIEEASKHVHKVWIFNTTIFDMPFLLSINGLCM